MIKKEAEGPAGRAQLNPEEEADMLDDDEYYDEEESFAELTLDLNCFQLTID